MTAFVELTYVKDRITRGCKPGFGATSADFQNSYVQFCGLAHYCLTARVFAGTATHKVLTQGWREINSNQLILT